MGKGKGGNVQEHYPSVVMGKVPATVSAGRLIQTFVGEKFLRVTSNDLWDIERCV
jgi:hypothetical protein